MTMTLKLFDMTCSNTIQQRYGSTIRSHGTGFGCEHIYPRTKAINKKNTRLLRRLHEAQI